jgi:energy-coupling factor transport system permease protein
MLKNITLGQYFPGDSFIHRLDPRTKLLATVALIAIVFVAQGFSGFLLIAAFVIGCAASTGIHLKYLIRGLKPIMFIIIFTFVLNLFFQTEGKELVHIGFIRITDQGLRMASFMAARLILLVVSSQLLTLTTSPIALTDGLEALFRPLEVIHFPAHEIAMMMSIALRFIPTLMDEADKIMKAQKARGADFENGRLVQRAKAMIPLLVPLFVGAFRRAEELALAMDARCYRGGAGRTRMKQLQYKRIDLFAALAILLLLAAVIALNRLKVF